MQLKKLYRIESRTADVFFIAQSLLLLIFFVSSVVRSHYGYSLVLGALLFGYFGWRLYQGPLLGKPMLDIGTVRMIFNDRAFTGRKVFQLSDVRQLSLIGPAGSRKIRLHTRSGVDEVVFQALRGKRQQRVMGFLRINLPEQILLVDEEPPSWADSVRGKY